MKQGLISIILVIYLILISGCEGKNLLFNTTDAISPTQASSVRSSHLDGFSFAINEIGLGSNDYIALTNYTNVPASLTGLYWCQVYAFFELPGINVAVGDTIRITTVDGDGLEGVVATNASLDELRSSDG